MTQHIVFGNEDSILEKMSHKKLFDAGRKKNVCNTYILLKHAKTFIDPLHNLYTPKEKLKKNGGRMKVKTQSWTHMHHTGMKKCV